MDISPITDEHYNRTSHGSHPLLQMKQGYNSATQFFQSQKAGKRNGEWRNTREPRKAAIIMIMKSERDKNTREPGLNY